MAQSNVKSRGWCFTLNNPGLADELDLEQLKNIAVYVIIGKETGAEGTPHYQGYCRFAHPQHFRRIKDLLPRAHIELQRGTAAQAAEYCKKDGDFEEFGDPPKSGGQSTKEKWRKVIALAEEGKMDEIKDDYPGIYLLHRPKLLSLRRRPTMILSDLVNEWWVGPTGTGKSRKLWADYPDHYPKALNKWWDGYDNEEIVAIEEFNPEAGKYLAHFVKIWADRYPFSPEIKGATIKKIRPKKIIVLSNYTIQQCFDRAEDCMPLLRRFKVIEFNNWD